MQRILINPLAMITVKTLGLFPDVIAKQQDATIFDSRYATVQN